MVFLFQAPAAFGLVSFLMHAGLERNRIRKHLLVFALAAPVMSMVTYLGLSKVSLTQGYPDKCLTPCDYQNLWSLTLSFQLNYCLKLKRKFNLEACTVQSVHLNSKSILCINLEHFLIHLIKKLLSHQFQKYLHKYVIFKIIQFKAHQTCWLYLTGT